MKTLLCAAGFTLSATESHLVPVLIGDAHLCRAMSEFLLDRMAAVSYAALTHYTYRRRTAH